MNRNLTVLYAAILLKDNAMAWWRHHVDLSDRKIVPRKTGWEDFCAAIQLAFEPVNRFKIARDKLAEVKQRGSVQAYAY